ncbi:MAG TPA: type II CAAX endopeptidase family protein [Chroococcidiopsis sp.]
MPSRRFAPVLFNHLAQRPAPVRILAFLLLLTLLWLPFAAVIQWQIKDPNRVTILAMSLLFVEFLVLMRWWGRRVYGRSHPFRHYGLGWSRQGWVELVQGLSIGLGSLFALFLLESIMGWVAWQPLTLQLGRFVVEGALTGLGTALAEELVFRGWLLDECDRDYAPVRAGWVVAILFATLHFLKPLGEVIRTFPQFPSLVILGILLVWAKRTVQGRLSLPIGLHGGLVWGYYIVNVGSLITYTGQAPDWVTGIDKNPLAGLAGIACLSLLALWIRGRSPQSAQTLN